MNTRGNKSEQNSKDTSKDTQSRTYNFTVNPETDLKSWFSGGKNTLLNDFPGSEIIIDTEVYNNLTRFEQNEVISRTMDYIVDNDLPYVDRHLYETALEMIENGNFPLKLKIKYFDDKMTSVISEV